MTYEKLYSNMVKKFTVEKDNNDYKLGEYMLMKADAGKTAESSNLPVAAHVSAQTTAISAFFSYVSDKLTIKEAPVRDKTIRSFPFRTSIAAFCSALVMCAMVVCCAAFGLVNNSNSDMIVSAEAYYEETINETENTEIDYSTDME
jgi:hypothetical protein